MLFYGEELASKLRQAGLYFVGKGINSKKSKDVSLTTPPYLVGYFGVLYIIKNDIAGLRNLLCRQKAIKEHLGLNIPNSADSDCFDLLEIDWFFFDD